MVNTLFDQLKGTLMALPEGELQEVLTFIESIRARDGRTAPPGSPERLLPLAGSWSFEQDEIDGILADIDRMRELELDP